MDKETRLRLTRQLDEMKKRMAAEASDLDYETQRYAIRSLERILEKVLRRRTTRRRERSRLFSFENQILKA